MTTECQFIALENQKLRAYISLILTEKEFAQRVDEIKQNFTAPDSERLILPILNRISKIQSERLMLEQELNLKSYDDVSVMQSKEQNSSFIS